MGGLGRPSDLGSPGMQFNPGGELQPVLAGVAPDLGLEEVVPGLIASQLFGLGDDDPVDYVATDQEGRPNAGHGSQNRLGGEDLLSVALMEMGRAFKE